MSLLILDPGMLSTIQDQGRRGVAHLGVPRAGALDQPAAALANRLVGNPEAAALIETTLTGLRARADAGHWVVVTGARCAVRVDGAPAAFAEPVWLATGAEIEIGPAVTGVRSYLAVAGGIDVDPVLGSRSTDTLAWVGPPRLAAGDELPVGRPDGTPLPQDTPRPRQRSALKLHPGPRADWVPDALGALTSGPWQVGEASNRVGLRLSGQAITRTDAATDRELPSEAVALGGVQLPPSGQPIVFLADHPTTGGYPVIAVVDPTDLWQCAQVRPGEQLRFRPA